MGERREERADEQHAGETTPEQNHRASTSRSEPPELPRDAHLLFRVDHLGRESEVHHSSGDAHENRERQPESTRQSRPHGRLDRAVLGTPRREMHRHASAERGNESADRVHGARVIRRGRVRAIEHHPDDDAHE